MSDYIKREDTLNTLLSYGIGWGAAKVKGIINSIPTADVVERKHGAWEERIVEDKKYDPYGFFKRRFYCSACGNWQTHGKTKFCPKCGAQMESEGE